MPLLRLFLYLGKVQKHTEEARGPISDEHMGDSAQGGKNMQLMTQKAFSVIATKLHFRISWLMSLCQRKNPFVMHNV